MLVESRPKLHITLSDFGLPRVNQSYLRTFCGTRLYAAPEVYARKNYDAAVDIRSPGVVVFQYAHGLLDRRSWGFDGATWTEDVIQALQAETRALCCPLIAFLSTAMLVQDRESRYSAHRCWMMVQKLDPSEFSCSAPALISNTYGDGDTVIYSTPSPRRVFGALGPGGVTEGRRDRSDTPPPSAFVSASTARRKSISRVSKPTKRQGRGNRALRRLHTLTISRTRSILFTLACHLHKKQPQSGPAELDMNQGLLCSKVKSRLRRMNLAS